MVWEADGDGKKMESGKNGKVNMTNFVSGWQFKIKCCFFRIYFVVQQTANTPKYILSTETSIQLTAAAENYIRFTIHVVLFYAKCLVRNDASSNVKRIQWYLFNLVTWCGDTFWRVKLLYIRFADSFRSNQMTLYCQTQWTFTSTFVWDTLICDTKTLRVNVPKSKFETIRISLRIASLRSQIVVTN